MGNWEYFIIFSYILPIGIGVALLFQKCLPLIGGILWVYSLFTFCVEITSATLAINGINTLWLYRIYLYVELVFPTLFFYHQFSKPRSKALLLGMFATSIILTTLTNLFDDWQNQPSIQSGITFACIAFIIIMYFVEMFQSEKVFNPFTDIYFVVGGTLLLGHSCILVYDVVYDYLVKAYFGTQIHSILNGINLGLILFYNVLYSYALWLSRNRRI